MSQGWLPWYQFQLRKNAFGHFKMQDLLQLPSLTRLIGYYCTIIKVLQGLYAVTSMWPWAVYMRLAGNHGNYNSSRTRLDFSVRINESTNSRVVRALAASGLCMHAFCALYCLDSTRSIALLISLRHCYSYDLNILDLVAISAPPSRMYTFYKCHFRAFRTQ